MHNLSKLQSKAKSQLKIKVKQSGFSLIELMVGMMIGLLATLAITQFFAAFEQQKRATTGNSDAQTNGSIALYSLQRDLQNSGYGLPVFGDELSPYNCPTSGADAPTVNHDSDATTPNIGISPVLITDGGSDNGYSDTVAIHSGDSMRAGVSVPMEAGTATNVVRVDNNMGCQVGDIALVINQANPSAPAALKCSMWRVQAVSNAAPISITLSGTTNVAVGNELSCMGVWNEVRYAVDDKNQFTRTGALVAGVPSKDAVPMVPEIVDLQAQYGISATPDSNQITQWVEPTGTWGSAITAVNRSRIKAVRVAIVARNGELGTENLTAACSSTSAVEPTGLCAWEGSATSPAPTIDLSAIDNWQRYRYRVYETIIPIRNIIWARKGIKV